MLLDRKKAAAMAEETLQLIQSPRYKDLVDRAVQGTREYPPDYRPQACTGDHATGVEVKNESTLAAARRLSNPAALNFASAKNPGGGFLSGARAQEESLARSSGLYSCLVGRKMYEHHRAHPDPMYTSWAVYSPGVPVLRDDDGRVLDEPYLCSFITAPAVNGKVVLERGRATRDQIRAVMDDRVFRVLSIAAENGHESMVLGAWGCGVFGNDPDMIAELFHQRLTRDFRGAFRHVVFAVLDHSPDFRTLNAFKKRWS
jgi:uncharacterized protein (TIGR02452 family)